MPSDVYTPRPTRRAHAERQEKYVLGAAPDTWPCVPGLPLLEPRRSDPWSDNARRVRQWAFRASGATESEFDSARNLVVVLGERACVSTPAGRWLEEIRLGTGPTDRVEVEPDILPNVEQTVVLAHKP